MCPKSRISQKLQQIRQQQSSVSLFLKNVLTSFCNINTLLEQIFSLFFLNHIIGVGPIYSACDIFLLQTNQTVKVPTSCLHYISISIMWSQNRQQEELQSLEVGVVCTSSTLDHVPNLAAMVQRLPWQRQAALLLLS